LEFKTPSNLRRNSLLKTCFQGKNYKKKHIYLYVKPPALLARVLVLRENNVFGAFEDWKIIPGIPYAS
jgi:hypothetical protein